MNDDFQVPNAVYEQKPRKKPKIIIVTIVLIIVIIVGLLIWKYISPFIVLQKDLGKLLQYKDLTQCQKIQDTYFHDECFLLFIASKPSDTAACDFVKNYVVRGECIGISAGSLNDISICEKLIQKDAWAACIVSAAIVAQEPSWCFKINPETTYPTEDGKTIDCFRGVAPKKGSIQICGNIGIMTSRYDCYIDVARVRNDPSICEEIAFDDSRRKDCDAIFSSQ